MAEPLAKNQLGQLFIDFGTKGFPTLLKSLNTVSAQFLLGKNAANQFVQSLTKPFKEAGSSAVEIGKMSNALATSSIEYQKLSMYLKKYNLSESLLGDIKKLETEILEEFGVSNWDFVSYYDGYITVKSRQALEKYDEIKFFKENTEKIASCAMYSPAQPTSLRPKAAEVWVDRTYILAAMGLLSSHYPAAALRIMKKELEYHGHSE